MRHRCNVDNLGYDNTCIVNGSDITTFTVLSQIIAECSPDQEVEVVLMRPNDNEYVKITMNVTLGSLD